MKSATDRQLRGMILLLLLIAAVMLCLLCARGCRGDNHNTLISYPTPHSDSVSVTVLPADTTTVKKKRRTKKQPRPAKTYPERSPLDENIY